MSDAESRDLLRAVGAADLVTVTPAGLQATFLPFVYDETVGEQGALLSHMMKINPQSKVDVPCEGLVLAHGLDFHVTSDWQPADSPIGTWDYETVHAFGEVTYHGDPEWIRDVVTRTVEKYEQRPRLHGHDIDAMLRALVGVEVRLTRVEGKAKLSQNKHPERIEQIIAGLEAKEMHAEAALLRAKSLPVASQRQKLVDGIRAKYAAERG